MRIRRLIHEMHPNGTNRCRLTTTLGEAARRLEAHGVSSLPVTDELLQVRGVVHARDVAAALAEAPDEAPDRCVSSVTVGPVAPALGDDTLQQAAARMRAQHLDALPVVDRRGVLLGVLRLNDLAGAVDDAGLTTTPDEAEAVLSAAAAAPEGVTAGPERPAVAC